ncbi:MULTISPECIES: endonuclease III [unclassified Flavobacterium]|uniref:endonuclease III domain-containing protein n=1 Tax=unclassified Flavobacterium TaxID=196869 RepID=UPI00095F2451|nr:MULTISPECIES: endonuclease III [unclassified Flavobacterium]MBN9285539.1 endonuclease III [Flavobacterium sp.]OJV71525.1 MAG: DNA lyase [Flavobacterium sp. 40-81]
MDLFSDSISWAEKLAPIITQYKDRKHPLEYQNLYQLVIMVILSAQDSDANINKIAPVLFRRFPNFESLQDTTHDDLFPYISGVRHFQMKSAWILETAQLIKTDKDIPLTMETLTQLKGIGRKSANVIMKESFVKPAVGIVVDLHVLRVAPRIGLIPATKDGNKAEKLLMQLFPRTLWEDVGMCISFLGREICRPTNPKCPGCFINAHCHYYNNN